MSDYDPGEINAIKSIHEAATGEYRLPGEKPREQHLAWCKERALEYADAGDPINALSSFISDMRKHPETADHSGLTLTAMLMMNGMLGTAPAVREHIEGFN